MPDERAADSYAIYSMLVSAPELQRLSAGQSHTWAVADTTVSGLPVGTTQMFRVRITIGKKTGDWSQAVSLFIH